MGDAGKFEHALIAVLHAARTAGCDLDILLENVKQDIVSNSLRPRPQDQHEVVAAVAKAIRELS
jgi:hypothetical protein